MIGLIVFTGFNLVYKNALNNHIKEEQTTAEKYAGKTAAALSQAMNIRLNLTNSLAAFTTINRDFTHQQFDSYAAILKNKMTGVRSLQLAPDGIVQYMTNLEANKKALGHNLFTDVNRAQIAARSRDQRTYNIAGPIDLIQGGQAIVARRPLYFSEENGEKEKFWGFATILIEIEPLLNDADFHDLEKNYEVAIRGKDGLGAEGDVFYGSSETFEQSLAVANVNLPDALWQIGMKLKPKNCHMGFIFSNSYWLVAILLAALITAGAYSILNRPYILNKEIDIATENLRTMLNSIGEAVIATDSNYRIVKLNPIAEKLTGWKFPEAEGKLLSEVFQLVDPATKAPLENPVTKVMDSGAIKEANSNAILINREAGEYLISQSVAPIFSKQHEMTGVILIFRDITTETELQSQLNQRNKMDSIGLLAGGIAHDFNNILTSIIGATQVLKLPKSNLNDIALKYVEMIINSATRAAELTAKLMAFGRKGTIISSAIDINVVIDDTVAIFRQTLDKNIHISVNKDASMHIINGDHTTLQNAMMNLGINASHALPKGGNITIRTENIYLSQEYCRESGFDIQEGQYIRLQFKDDGEGIDPDNLGKIFEPFFTTKEPNKGTGLGLSAVYGTILEHRGAIKVKSEKGNGALFEIYLPCSKDDIKEWTDSTKFTAGGEGQLVMLVDDEETILLTASELLEEMGFQVITAHNGKEAVELFQDLSSDISLIIMDMIMPEMNGYDAFYKLRAINRNCPIIIASGYYNEEKMQELNSSGLDGFLKKPYTEETLNEMLHKIAEQ